MYLRARVSGLGRLGQNCLVLLVHTLEVGDLMVSLEVPNPGGHFIDQVFVMGDQKDCPLIALQGDVERVDRFEIKVVGRFIEDQYIGLLQH